MENANLITNLPIPNGLWVEVQDELSRKSLILQDGSIQKDSKNHKQKVICADSCHDSY